VCFQASLVVGTLLIATASGQHRAAAAIYAGSVSGWLGANALYRLGEGPARTWRLLRNVDRATIVLLVAGSATSLVLVRTPKTAPVVALILGAALLYIVGGTLIRLRRAAPLPGVFGDRELAGHSLVCAAAIVQYVGLSLLIL
jgi:predicted membrane channel-forming protein YqfA (hemolysin III family)